ARRAAADLASAAGAISGRVTAADACRGIGGRQGAKTKCGWRVPGGDCGTAPPAPAELPEGDPLAGHWRDRGGLLGFLAAPALLVLVRVRPCMPPYRQPRYRVQNHRPPRRGWPQGVFAQHRQLRQRPRPHPHRRGADAPLEDRLMLTTNDRGAELQALSEQALVEMAEDWLQSRRIA